MYVSENTIFAAFGGLAHLARALAWQARGDRFESGILHKIKLKSQLMKIGCDFLFLADVQFDTFEKNEHEKTHNFWNCILFDRVFGR